MLECAIESLLCLERTYLKGISVRVDERDYLDETQIEVLRRLYDPLQVVPWPGVTKPGRVRSASREIQAFAEVAKSLGDHDYVVKADSDLLFISPWIFPLILRSGMDAVGDGRYLDFEYFQGGCYFIKKPMIRRLEPFGDEATLAALFPGADGSGEDRYLHDLLRREGARIWMTRYMAFPDEFKRFRGLGPRERSRYCVLHFVRGKDVMPQYFRRTLTGDRSGELAEH